MRTYCMHRELYSLLCGDLNGKEILKRRNICTQKAGPLYYIAETDSSISNYTPIKKKKKRSTEVKNLPSSYSMYVAKLGLPPNL